MRLPSVTVGCGSLLSTCDMVWSTAGLITSSNGFGKKPSTTISSSSGASAEISRTLRSGIPTTPSRTGPVIVRW